MGPAQHLAAPERQHRRAEPTSSSTARARVRGARTEERPAKVLDADGARGVCLNLLASRARSRAELEAALAKREVDDEIACTVLDRLTRVGLIDDEAFANSLVSSLHRQRGLSRAELIRRLRHKGVADDISVQAAAVVDSDTERSTALDLVTRKMAAMSHLQDEVKTRRLVGLLARKGYSPELCYSVVREAVRA